MYNYNISHLRELEAESIFVMREVAAQFEKPILLFSGGKDSIVMFHLSRKSSVSWKSWPVSMCNSGKGSFAG